MATRTQEIREWAGDYVEDVTREVLVDITDEAETDLLEQSRNQITEATEDFYVNLIYGNSIGVSEEEDIRQIILDIPGMSESISEIADEISISSLAERQGDVYRKSTNEWINEELPDDLAVEADDFPARQRYDIHIDNMMDVAVLDGVEAAKEPSVLYDAIRQEHPTQQDYDEFFRQRQEEMVNVMKQQMTRAAEEMGDDPEEVENAVDQYENDLLDAMSVIHEDLRERWMDRVYQSEV